MGSLLTWERNNILSIMYIILRRPRTENVSELMMNVLNKETAFCCCSAATLLLLFFLSSYYPLPLLLVYVL